MRASRTAACSLVAACLLPFTHAFAQGALDPPGPPGPTMVTLGQLHDNLNATATNVAALEATFSEFDCQSLNESLMQLTSTLDGVALLNEQLGQLLVGMASMTNALGDVDWSDVLVIREDVEYLTNVFSMLNGLDAIAAQMAAMTNSLTQVVAITNFAGSTLQQTSVITQLLGAQQVELDAILALEQQNHALLQSLTNSLP